MPKRLPTLLCTWSDTKIVRNGRAIILDIRTQQSIWISRRACESHNHFCNLGERAARDSIVNVLLDLFIRARLLWPKLSADEIHLPLTQVEIAGGTGFTNELVNHIL